MEGTLTPTYSLNQGDGMGFGNGGIWLFAILALFLFGNGGMWGGRNQNCATTEDLNNVSNFARLEGQVQNNGNLVESKMDSLGTAMQTGFNQIGNGICSLGYEMANKFAGLEASTTAQIQSVKDMIQANEIQTLRDQLGALQLAQATAGVVRYPTATTYSVASPCFSTGCGCNAI